jgi:hypothetical protein
MRSMVEGAHLRASRNDPGNYAVEIAQYLTSRNSHHVKTLFPQKLVPSGIALGLIAATMRLSFHLDDQAMAEAGEVGGNRSNRKLRSELQSVGPSAEGLEQQHFWQAKLTPELAGALYLLDGYLEDAWAPSTVLRTVPLPVPGRIFVTVIRHRHILNTPNCGRSGIGALWQAAKARPRTSRVWAGSMMPSSHSRAVACQGLPWAS